MGCLVCGVIEDIRNQRNPFAVAETANGYVVLGWYQFFRGYSLFLAKRHVVELHDLEFRERMQFLAEMSLVAEAVAHTFEPKKMNIEMLGNQEPHLHAHLFPRHDDDPLPNLPVFCVPSNIREAPDTRPNADWLDGTRLALQRNLAVLFERQAGHVSGLTLQTPQEPLYAMP